MSTTIKLKNSTVLDKVPTSLEIGELAINANAGSPAAYIEDSSGAIVQLAGPGAEPDATETVKGIAQIATTAQVTAGTDDTTIVTPAKLAAATPAEQDLQAVCDEGSTTTTGATFNGTVTANLFSGPLPYSDLTGTPTIPTNNNQLTNGAGYITSADGGDADKLDGQEGSYYLDYGNFTNTPTIPTNNNQLTNGAGYYKSGDNVNFGTIDAAGQILSSNTGGNVYINTGNAGNALQAYDSNASGAQPTVTITKGGSITAAGNVTSGSGALYSRLHPGYLTISNVGNFGQAFGLYNTTTSDYSVKLEMDGTATFAGEVNVGGGGSASNAGITLNDAGYAYFARSSSATPFMRGYRTDTGANTFTVLADGAATFAGRIDVGSASLSSIGLTVATNSSSNTVSVQNYHASGKLFSGWNGSNTETVTITNAGNITAAGTITAAGYNLSSLPTLP